MREPSYSRSMGDRCRDSRNLGHSFNQKASQEGWKVCPVDCILLSSLDFFLGLVHISNIQVGARANSAADLLSRGQPVRSK